MKIITLRVFVLFLLQMFILNHQVFSIETANNEISLISLKTELGSKVDLDLEFFDTSGKKLRLADFAAEQKPIIILPGYYTCPRLCGLLFDGAAKLVNELKLNPAYDFKIISASFNFAEKLESAIGYENKYNKSIASADKAWSFIFPAEEKSLKLFSQLGFSYLKDGNDFAHSSALFILTPSGEISQYFTGVDFDPFSVKLALVEASQGEIGNLIDHALLYCFRFDPTKGKYTWVVGSALKIGGALTILLMGLFLGTLWLKEKKRV
jgi:protein SCO1/2